MAHWIKAAKRDQLHEGEMMEVTVDGQQLVLALVQSKLLAFNALCPHASAPLAQGYLRSNYIICPLHAYRFELTNGRCLKPPDGPRLRLYEASLRRDEVWIKLKN